MKQWPYHHTTAACLDWPCWHLQAIQSHCAQATHLATCAAQAEHCLLYCLQLATVAAQEPEDSADGSPSEAAATSQAAYDILFQLATDPQHGLAEPQQHGVASAELGGQQLPGK